MRGSSSLLARDGLARWLRTPGYLVVLAVALVPAGLTAAWTWTHDADLSVTSISWDRDVVTHGDPINITAIVLNARDTPVDAFNVTLRVGYYEPDATGNLRWRDTKNETMRLGPIDAGATAQATMAWNATAGTLQIEAWADVFSDEIKEIEDLNNYRPSQIAVRYPTVRPTIPTPFRAEPSNNTTLPQVNVSLVKLEWTPTDLYQDDNATFTMTVTNAGPDRADNVSVELQVFRLSVLGQLTGLVANFTQTTNLSANETATFDFTWSEIDRGLFAVGAFALTPSEVNDTSTADDIVIQQLEVDRRLVWDEPEPQATAKDFYRNQILLPLQLTLLIPLVGIFYAGNVIQDDRAQGNLPYLLTRPVPRWWLPLTRFAIGFTVALIPVLVGVVLTYALLLGTPRSNPGYLYWPIVVGTLVVFLYSAVFTLVGVVSRRPYLVGVVYVLGFETLLLVGRRFLVNGQPLVQDWVLNLSLSEWVRRVLEGWDVTQTLQWWPNGDEAVRATFVVIGIGVASLAAACWVVMRREIAE